MTSTLYTDSVLNSDINQSISQITSFLTEYSWLADSYVSDFFSKPDNWERLPLKWRECLSGLSPPEIATLLDAGQYDNHHVWPLSLLGYKACVQALSLNRQPVDLNDEATTASIKKSFPNSVTSSLNPQSRMSGNDEGKCLPSNESREIIIDGQLLSLDHLFRKHVKPKKQHEIQRLAQAVQLISDVSGCGHVVDVGSGQGHLSRLLTFGMGLKVTTVEGSGCHAPKAQKFDREIKVGFEKAKHNRAKKLKLDAAAASTLASECDRVKASELPNHIVQMLEPGMSTDQFLQVLQSRQSIDVQNTIVHPWSGEHVSVPDVSCAGASKCQTSECVDVKQHSETLTSLTQAGQCSMDTSDACQLCVIENSRQDIQTSDMDEAEPLIGSGVTSNDGQSEDITTSCHTCNHACNHSHTSSSLERSSDNVSGHRNCCALRTCRPENTVKSTEVAQEYSSLECDRTLPETSLCGSHSEFILSGLHACGDLSPTLLRVFVSCSDAVAVTSVACCYMKLSTDKYDCCGYPMSDYVKNHPGSLSLSYQAREMACHFVDAYCQRLKEDLPTLKLHCYRAALQVIIREKAPMFQHGCIKLSIKKAEQMPFQRYAELSLNKLGLDSSLTTSQVQRGEDSLKDWKHVVIYYVLRLCLAPVIESLILLDRMLYIREQGINSMLLPIFDPALSPRNFVLLAVKKPAKT